MLSWKLRKRCFIVTLNHRVYWTAIIISSSEREIVYMCVSLYNTLESTMHKLTSWVLMKDDARVVGNY